MKIRKLFLASTLFVSGALGLWAADPQTPAPAAKKAAEPPVPEKEKSEEETTGPQRGFQFRNLGPAAGGGRITAIAGIPGQPQRDLRRVRLGRSLEDGRRRQSRSSRSSRSIPPSIGAIAIAPSNPNLVWVGTGEANPRNNVIDGHGVYFSSDAGASWRLMGLADAGQISRIVIDPGDPNTVYVAVLGNVWKPNADRGHLPHDRRRRRPGRRFSTSTIRRAPPTWRCSRATRAF